MFWGDHPIHCTKYEMYNTVVIGAHLSDGQVIEWRTFWDLYDK